MSSEQRKATVSRFNDLINTRDIDGLSQMMTDDHIFIDTAGQRISGKPACVRAWTGFFAAFPDYRNHFERMIECEGVILVDGRSACSDPRLIGPALWAVKLRDDLVSEWRVLQDNASNRDELGWNR